MLLALAMFLPAVRGAVLDRRDPHEGLALLDGVCGVASAVASALRSLLDEAAKKAQDRIDEIREQLQVVHKKYEAAVAPLREELAELEDAVARITGKPAPTSAPRAAPRARATATSPGRGRRTPSGTAPRGANREAILTFVTQRPGATPTEIADATDISKAVAYTTLAKMVEAGQIDKQEPTGGSATRRPEPLVSLPARPLRGPQQRERDGDGEDQAQPPRCVEQP
jgi:hypothetical protein